MQNKNDLPFKRELVRKSIHLTSLSIPAAYYYLSRETALEILIPLAVASVALDMSRYYIPSVGKWFYALFHPILREHERDHARKLLNGASYVLISAAVCVFIFPKLIAVTSFAVLIVSDTTAALVGRLYGRRKFFQKSFEGAAAFFVSALAVVAVVPKLHGGAAEYAVGAAAAFVAAVIEAASIDLRMDDNFSVPLGMGLAMWLFYYMLAVVQPERYQSLYTALMAFR